MRMPPPTEAALSGGDGAALPEATARTEGQIDFGGAAPGWEFGQQGYAFLPDGKVLAAYPDRATGQSHLLSMADEGTHASAL